MKKNLNIDAGFINFHDFCLQQNITFNIISAGLMPVLKWVLEEFTGSERVIFLSSTTNLTNIGKAD